MELNDLQEKQKVKPEYENALRLIRAIIDNPPLNVKDNNYFEIYNTLIEVIGTLKPREADIVKLRYGLNDGQNRTFPEIKEINKYDISLERLRQINRVALRKLSHPTRTRILYSLFSNEQEQQQEMDKQYAQYFNTVKNMFNAYSALEKHNRQDFLGKLEVLISEFSSDKLEGNISNREDEDRKKLRKILNETVNNIGLSVRVSTVLVNENITKVYQLAMKSERTLLKYRNFGRKSLTEVREKLGNLGLTNGMAFDPSLIEKINK